jgi:hypothetical protein
MSELFPVSLFRAAADHASVAAGRLRAICAASGSAITSGREFDGVNRELGFVECSCTKPPRPTLKEAKRLLRETQRDIRR